MTTAACAAPSADRVVVVTGAGRGLGLEICRTLLEQGSSVIANFSTTRAALDELEALHPERLTLVQGDIGEEDTSARLAAAARELGGPDALVHNAAITRDRPLVRMTVDDWDAVQRVNLRGAFLATKHAVRLMMRRRYGRILYISSVAATVGNAGQANYAASKAALDGLSRTVAQEYGAYNVRTTVLAPGIIDVGLAGEVPAELRRQKGSQFLLGEATPQEVAATVGFLVSPDADHINAAVIRMDGGLRF